MWGYANKRRKRDDAQRGNSRTNLCRPAFAWAVFIANYILMGRQRLSNAVLFPANIDANQLPECSTAVNMAVG